MFPLKHTGHWESYVSWLGRRKRKKEKKKKKGWKKKSKRKKKERKNPPQLLVFVLSCQADLTKYLLHSSCQMKALFSCWLWILRHRCCWSLSVHTAGYSEIKLHNAISETCSPTPPVPAASLFALYTYMTELSMLFPQHSCVLCSSWAFTGSV